MDELKETLRILNLYTAELAGKIRQNLRDQNINASYNLFNSIDVHVVRDDPSGQKSQYRIVLNLEEYWKNIEYGRRAGSKFPPIEDIKHWLQVKPIMPREDDSGKIPTEEQLTYLIGRKIARDGIQPRPFVENAINDTLDEFYTNIHEALSKDAVSIIEEIFTNSFNGEKLKTINIK